MGVFGLGNLGSGRRLKKKVMNELVDKLALVDVAVTEPNIDGLEPREKAQALETHFFANFAHRRLTVRFPLAHMALGESPFAIGIHDHGKEDRAADALQYQASRRDLGAMSLAAATTLA